MISAFGVDHGVISKNEYGWHSKEARKRTLKEVKDDSKMSAGHGNAQRMAAHTGVWTGLGAATGATAGIGLPGKYKVIGAGAGAGAGAGLGMISGKEDNMRRSAQRNVGAAIKRKDVRRVKPGERTTSFTNQIVPE